MDAILIQILNGLDKGAAYALIALGLTLAFGTLGIVNFAHGALFMLGAFCAVVFQKILTTSVKIKDEIVKAFFGANPIPTPAPDIVAGSAAVGAWFGLSDNLVYPWWRLIYISFAAIVIFAVFAFLKFTTFGMVVRAGMADRETVGLLGIDIQKRFTIVFAIAALVAGLAGVMYAPILPPDYHMGMDFLVLSFVVVVVGGMGSLGGAVAAGFLLGILQSFASMNEVKSIIPGIDQIIIYLVAVVILLVRPRGLMGREGVFED